MTCRLVPSNENRASSVSDSIVVSSEGVHVPPDDDGALARTYVRADVREDGVAAGQHVGKITHDLSA